MQLGAVQPKWRLGMGQTADSRHLSRAEVLRCHAAPPQQHARPVFITDSGTGSFLDWARAQGIQFAKLQPALFDGVRGLAASAPIAADDIIVSVPRQAALTLPPKQRCPCPEYVAPAYWDAAPWFVKLGVRLLAEQRKGPASPFSQWLQQLPKQVDSPVSWSREQLQLLQYGHLIHKVVEQQQEWGALYEKLLQEGLVDKAAPPSKQDFIRALSLVRSRTFSGPYVASTLQDRLRLAGLVGVLVAANTALGGDLSNGLSAAAAVFLFNIIYELLLSNKLKQYAMCPVIDLLNHSSSKTTEVSYDYPRDAFLVAAAAGYAPDAQVFISYGAQSNDSLMQMYGFVEPDNPHDVYVMTSLLKWFEQLAPPCQARLDALNREGLLSALQEVVITRQGCGSQTLQALRYLLAPAAAGGAVAAAGAGEQQQQQQQGLPAGPPSSYAAAADAGTEQQVALVLVHACQQELAVLNSSSAAADAAASGNGSSSGSGGGKVRGSRKGGGVAAAGGGASSEGGTVSAAVAAAAAAAFRREKRKVLLECLQQLTGESAGSASGAAADSSRGGSEAAGLTGLPAGAAVSK